MQSQENKENHLFSLVVPAFNIPLQLLLFPFDSLVCLSWKCSLSMTCFFLLGILWQMKGFDWLTLVIPRVTYGKVLIAFLFLSSVYLMVVDRGQCCSLVSPLKRFAKSIYKNLCIKPRANGRKIVNHYELLHECMSVVWVSMLFFCSKAQCDPYF